MTEIDPQDTFISLSQHVRKNIKTGKEELEVALYDVRATDSDGAVVTITAKEFEVNRRSAQTHEAEQAARSFKKVLDSSLNEEVAESN